MKKKVMDKKNSGNIWLLGGTSLFNDAGSEMITAILPFYITLLGGGGIAIGLVSGLREGLSSIFKIIGGWFSDRIGKRKPIIFFGYFFSILIKFLMVLANYWQQLIALVSLERAGKMRDAPRDVIISVSTKKRGRGFGIHQMMDNVGGIIGTILIIILFWKLNLGFKTIILTAAAISSLALIPLFFVKEKKSKPIRKNLFKGIKSLDKKLKYFIFVTAVFAIANFGLYMFMLLKAREISGSIVTALILYAMFNIIYALFTVPFGSFSDKIGRKKILFIGYILLIVTTAGFAYFSTITEIAILFAFYGLVMAITEPTQKAFVSDLSGKMKGTAFGTFYVIRGFVTIIAGVIAGILWNISPEIMFYYLSAIAIIATLLLIFAKEK